MNSPRCHVNTPLGSCFSVVADSHVVLIFFVPVGLVNSQVVLKGIESDGCVLVAAGNARILNRLHIPVWSKGEIFNKNTWFGNVENLQVILLTCV